MGERRVVITGMGTINPLGQDVETTWQNLLKGESGAGRITSFDPSPFLTQIACEVKGFDPTLYMPSKKARRLDRFIQFAIASTSQALRQANLSIDEENADEIGVIIGSCFGGFNTIHQGYSVFLQRGHKRITPLIVPNMLIDMAGGQVAIFFGARGPNLCIVTACATGTDAIGEAFEIIKRGDALAMIAGGAEASITPFLLASFDRARALSRRNDEPERASRPFDAKRDGFVAAEGAAVLILENLDYAKARGAEPLAEIIGYASNNDAYHVTAPAPGGVGMAKCMEKAIKKAGISPKQVGYINAHGTSTPLNDAAETEAIKKVFGDYAYDVPISSTKSMVGHLLGASGALEAIVCVKTVREGLIHPTINYEYPDPQCDLDYVPNKPRKADVKFAISNSFGFGGHNATLVFSKFHS
jgi:beta-ketoacyl-acyl-carrier-protein synthase II